MTIPQRTEKAWKWVDHTADIRMEVRGATLEHLFVNAAYGLTDILAEESDSTPELSELDLTLEGGDQEELLVDWLREVLFLNQTRDFVLVEARRIKISEYLVQATLCGRRKRKDETPEVEIKAVTYHGLSITKESGGYVARILFDI